MDEKSRQVNLTERGLVLIEELLVKEGIMDEGGVSVLSGQHHADAPRNGGAARSCPVYPDVDYIVKDGEVIIVDEHTGRTMQGRRWSDGLHQAVEAKKVCRSRTKTKRWLRSPSRTTSVCMKNWRG